MKSGRRAGSLVHNTDKGVARSYSSEFTKNSAGWSAETHVTIRRVFSRIYLGWTLAASATRVPPDRSCVVFRISPGGCPLRSPRSPSAPKEVAATTPPFLGEQDPKKPIGGTLEIVIDEYMIEEARMSNLVVGGTQTALYRGFVLARSSAQSCLEGGQIRRQNEHRDRRR